MLVFAVNLFFIKEKGGIMSTDKSWTPSVIIY